MGNIEERRQLVALRIKNARESRGVTQSELSQRLADAGLNLGASTIAKIESGKRALEIVEAQALIEALQLGWSDLYFPPDLENAARAVQLQAQALGNFSEFITSNQRSGASLEAFVDAVVELYGLRGEVPDSREDLERIYGYVKEASTHLSKGGYSMLSAANGLGITNIDDGDDPIHHGLRVNLPPLSTYNFRQPWPIDVHYVDDGEG